MHDSMKFALKSLFLSLALLIISLALPSNTALAGKTEDLGDILNSEDISQEKYIVGNVEEAGLMDSIMYSLYCNLSECRDNNGDLAKSGLTPQMGKVIAFMYENQPASSGQYFADVLDNIGVPTVQTAQAQGVGYRMLVPMLAVWKAFRNLSYSIYILLFGVIGLMIIFRTKVNAQTIVTIQTALPNLIITLVLITFSYAIAGLMLDLMYFSIYFIAYVAEANGLISKAGEAVDRLNNNNVLTMVFQDRELFYSSASQAVQGVLSDITGDGAGEFEMFLEAIGWGVLAYVIVAGALAIQLIKLLWSLTRSYIMVLVQTVTAPLQILPNAIPGSTSFTTWLRKTFSYIAPFPVVAAMFIFAAILIGQGSAYDPATAPFGVQKLVDPTDPLTNISYPPFIGSGSGLSADSFLAVLGFMVVLMTPAAAKSVQEALQVKESMYTSEIGAAISAGAWPIKGGYGLIARRREERRQKSMYAEIGKAMKDDTSPKS